MQGNKRYLQSDRQTNKKNIFTFRWLNETAVQNKTMKRLSCLLDTLCHTTFFAIEQLVVYSVCNTNANILFNEKPKTITCMSDATQNKINLPDIE